MAVCGRRAMLYITRSVEGTSTHVARERVELTCDREAGHDGLHRDFSHDESWESGERDVTSLFRHEDDN